MSERQHAFNLDPRLADRRMPEHDEPGSWTTFEITAHALCYVCRQAFELRTWPRVYKLNGVWFRYHQECWPWT
jgi:hypothetical protein